MGSTTTPLKVGILFLSDGVQFLDVGPIDILGSLTPSYLSALPIPPNVVAKGIDMEFHYIVENGEKAFQLTSSLKVYPTTTISSATKLDILFIPGPLPTYVPSEEVKKFILESQDSVALAIMTVCTGVIPAAHSGLLKGKYATGPRMMLPMLKAQLPDVKWEEKRWSRDGKIWTSGGVLNGMDMMAAFVREHWDPEPVEMILSMLDVSSRGQDYPAA